MRDPSHKYASDSRSSEELVEAHRQELKSDEDSCEAIGILHFRGGKREFNLGKQLTESDNPDDRSIGADILAQLGWGDKTFHDESVDILLRLLDDPDPYVIYCAAVGLGHRNDARAIEALAKLTEHDDSQVRFGVTFGLSCHDDERAISSLIQLSHDSDHDTRNWAMFGLGSQTDMDSPEIRAALALGLKDADSEIRGEALVGLARRKDPRVYNAILKEWKLDDISILSLEAAEELADPNLVPLLEELEKSLDFTDDEYFHKRLKDAISSCQGSKGVGTEPKNSADAKGRTAD
jgi:HEAT repeat protein